MAITMAMKNKHQDHEVLSLSSPSLTRRSSVVPVIRQVLSPVQLPVGLLGALERRRELLQRHELLRPSFLLVGAGVERLLLRAQGEPRVLPAVHHHSAVGGAVAGADAADVGLTLVHEVA